MVISKFLDKRSCGNLVVTEAKNKESNGLN